MKKMMFYMGLLAFSALTVEESFAEPLALPEEIKAAFRKAGLPLAREKRRPAAFALKSLDGKTVNLNDYAGKVVFINFWATWCPPCRSEMPSMEALYEKLHGKGFEMLACDIMEDNETVKKYVKDNKLSFPVLFDKTGAVSGKYGVQGIPATFVLDRSGSLILSVVGSRDWNTPQIQAAFEALIEYGK
jgi:thiol-disulfide isomerase/thioredoxin